MAVTSKNNLRNGSSGDDVLDLQRRLNSTGYGYNLAEDGIFGTNTEKAVRDYQQRTGLAVDGIVGTNTWGALTNANASSTGSSSSTSAANNTPTFEYGAYKPSDTVAQAEALLQQQLANKPGSYQSTWQNQLNDIIQKIQNREKFSYDLNGDALYQQYKDQYTTQGKMAMMDTMGQAATLTGGYGSSYAQTAGQQAYQGYLQQLNDKVPELYQLALSQYEKKGNDMYDQAALMAQMEDQDYGRHRDTVSDYYTELDRLINDSRYQSEMDYSKWADNREFSYGQHRDQQADEKWQAEFDEAKRQYDQQYELAAGKKGATDDGTPTGNPDYDGNGVPDTAPEDTDPSDNITYTQNGSLTKGRVIILQRILGVSADGLYGPETQKAAGGRSADEAYNYFVLGKGNPNVNPNPTGTGFTGTTYSEAAAYLRANGKYSSGLMTQSEWQGHKNRNNSAGGEHEASSYQEYLAAYIYGMMN